MTLLRHIKCLTIALLVSLPAISASSAPGSLLPSEAIRLMLWDAMHDPTTMREAVFEDLLPRVITDDLDDDELFFLGEVYFFALMPEEARDAFYPLRHGNSMLARVAWQRLLQIRFRAFGMHDRVEREMIRFRETFPAHPADRLYLSNQVVNFGRAYAEQGEYDKIVAHIEAELAALDYDGAYESWLLPSQFFDAYKEVGRADEAVAHLTNAAAGLRKTLEARLENPPDSDQYYMLPARRYAFFFSPVTEKLGWDQKNDTYRALIARLENAISEAR